MAKTIEVHFFKPSGKWYTTEDIEMECPEGLELISDAFEKALRNHFKDQPHRLTEMDAVCVDLCPPRMLRSGAWAESE